MKKLAILLICMLPVFVLHAQKSAPLTEVLKPGMMAVWDNHLFITEQPRIHVYSLQDFKLIKTFGKGGEGPRELKFSPFGPPMVIYPYSDRLLVNSMNKVTIFSRDGKYLNEARVPSFTIFGPLKNGYVGYPMVRTKNNQSVLAVAIYNEKFEKLKEVHRSDITVGPGASFNMPGSQFTHVTYEDKIFVVIGTEGFVIDVFDLKGNKLYRIKKEYKPLPVTGDYEKKTMHWFKNESPFKQFIGTMIKVTFKSHFPVIKDILVDSGRIYVITHKTDKDKREVVVLDLKGKELKRLFLEFPVEGPYFPPNHYTIRNNTLYTLVENEDEEEWELHMEKIK